MVIAQFALTHCVKCMVWYFGLFYDFSPKQTLKIYKNHGKRQNIFSKLLGGKLIPKYWPQLDSVANKKHFKHSGNFKMATGPNAGLYQKTQSTAYLPPTYFPIKLSGFRMGCSVRKMSKFQLYFRFMNKNCGILNKTIKTFITKFKIHVPMHL